MDFRFQAHEPGHIVWRFTQSLDDSINVRSSYKYYITTPPDFTHGSEKEGADADTNNAEAQQPQSLLRRFAWNPTSLFLSYTGEFDLFLVRDSDPVVGREHNPTATIRYVDPTGVDWKPFKYLDVSVQHRSNGQTMEPNGQTIREGDPYSGKLPECNGMTMENLEALYECDPRSEEFDRISRGVNFVSLEVYGRVNDTSKKGNINPLTGQCHRRPLCVDVWLRVNVFHWSDETNVSWGVGKGTESITDYERLRARVSTTLWSTDSSDNKLLGFPTLRITGVGVVGDGGNLSVDLSAHLPIQLDWGIVGRAIEIPFFLKFHKGPMAYLSDYTRPVTSLSIGLRIY